jgi:hypothetical protein
MENLSLTDGVSRPRWRDLMLLSVIPAIAIAVAASSALSSSASRIQRWSSERTRYLSIIGTRQFSGLVTCN